MAQQVVSISWVRNEGDVIEAFVRHNSMIVDRMVIIDNDSRDDTVRILKSLQNEGLPIDIRHDDATTHRQGEALTALMRELFEKTDAPDWILPLDADEFIRTSGNDLHAVLQTCDCESVVLLPWRTYVPTVDDSADEPHPLRRIRHRRSAEHPQWCKICIPASLARGSDYVITLGSHTFFDPKRGLNSPMIESAALSLAHFPVRSINQIRCKIAANWLRARSDAAYRPGTSYQWQALYESMKRGDIWDLPTLQRIGMTYGTDEQWKELESSVASGVQLGDFLTAPAADRTGPATLVEDPIPTDAVLQYPHVPLNPWRVLAETAEDIAASHAELAHTRREQV